MFVVSICSYKHAHIRSREREREERDEGVEGDSRGTGREEGSMQR